MKLKLIILVLVISFFWVSPKISHLLASGLEVNLPEGEGRNLVVENCTACHTASIIKQNRMSRKEWNETIDWMQKNQGMWDLEEAERTVILNYLAEYLGKKENQSFSDSERNQNSNPMYEFQYLPNPL